MSIPGNHPLTVARRHSPTPADTDCVLVLDVVVPWMPGQFKPGRRRKVIRIEVDPIVRMTAIYEFPSDLSITADPAKALRRCWRRCDR